MEALSLVPARSSTPAASVPHRWFISVNASAASAAGGDSDICGRHPQTSVLGLWPPVHPGKGKSKEKDFRRFNGPLFVISLSPLKDHQVSPFLFEVDSSTF